MTTLLCENSNSENEIFVSLFNDDEIIYYQEYEQNNFKSEDIYEILNDNKNKIDSKLQIKMLINVQEDLELMLEIISESTDLEYELDLTKSEIKHMQVIKDIEQKLNDKQLLKIKYQECSKEIPYDEYKSMYKKLYEIIEEVKQLDLSPLEQVMYVFDIVKSNIYKEDPVDISNSRSLNNVLKSDYIVCVGYSNYMEFILKELGHDINTVSFKYEDAENGHRRNSIYLKDQKYYIDNVFFLDATSNSKRTVDDTDYIDNYTAFLLPYGLFKKANEKEHFKDDCHYAILEYSKEQVKDIINNGLYLENEKYKKLIMHSLRKMLNRKSDTGNKITLTMCRDNRKELLKYYEEMYTLYNTLLKPVQFLECLYNVRGKQYETGRIDTLPTEDDYEQIMIKKFGKGYLRATRELIFFQSISGDQTTNRDLLKLELEAIKQKTKTLKKSK